METIHVTFDELLQTMSPVNISSGPEPMSMTPGQFSSGLIPNQANATNYVLPTDIDLELLFQPMFDEYFEVTRVNAHSTFDAPSISFSSSSSGIQPPVIQHDVAIGPTNKDTPITQATLHHSNNPITGELGSAQSSSGDVSIVEPNQVTQPPDHLRKWSKDHPLDNIVGNPSRPVSTRKQLAFDALWCLWELVPRLVYVMVIALKWIYMVKLDEYGDVLEKKARLVAKGYRQEEDELGISDVDDGTNVVFLRTTSFSKPLSDTPMVDRLKLDGDLKGIPVAKLDLEEWLSYQKHLKQSNCLSGILKGTIKRGLFGIRIGNALSLTLMQIARSCGYVKIQEEYVGKWQFLGDRLMRSQLKDYGFEIPGGASVITEIGRLPEKTTDFTKETLRNFDFLRVTKLEQDMSEVKKFDHSADVLASIQSQVPPVVDNKKQESEKSQEEIIRIKREQEEKNQEPTYTIKSSDQAALEEFDLKSALFKSMHKNKSANRNPANYRLYHALMEALIEDENAMDKEVADTVRDHKRKHDDDDDDDDEGPPAGSNQGKSTKRRRTRESESAKKPSTTKESSKDKDPKGMSQIRRGTPIPLTYAKIPDTTTWFRPILEEERHASPEPEWVIPPIDLPEIWIGNRELSKEILKVQHFLDGERFVPDISNPLPLGGPLGQDTKNETELEELVPSLWIESEQVYDISAAYGITHWWFSRKQFYINKHSEPSDRDAVRSHMRILSVISIKTYERYGYNYLREIVLRRANYNEYKISEKDFKSLHPNDFEDLNILHIQGKLDHLPKQDKVNFCTTRVSYGPESFVIGNLSSYSYFVFTSIQDLQLGIESYQTKLNLEQPNWDESDFPFKEDYTIVFKPRVVIYRDGDDNRKMIRIDEFNKGMENRKWTEDDKRRSEDFIKENCTKDSDHALYNYRRYKGGIVKVQVPMIPAEPEGSAYWTIPSYSRYTSEREKMTVFHNEDGNPAVEAKHKQALGSAPMMAIHYQVDVSLCLGADLKNVKSQSKGHVTDESKDHYPYGQDIKCL
ncbi:hypothetical protein Tco_0317682 [Tanacetum coccineum]